MAEAALEAAKDLLVEGVGHCRANHLHREGLAQALRLHEASAAAAREFHRAEIKVGNDQHAREILQGRVQHEEGIDLEKRYAVRENIRDEWTQLSDKAETVLIVNTLVLGTSFAMLVEGSLPESVTLQRPVALVAYFCSLSASICFLLCSVRFAMVLRFRVGRTVVEEMRCAIETSAHMDDEFRHGYCYEKCNRPKRTRPACDVRVQPFTSQLVGKNVRVVGKQEEDHAERRTTGASLDEPAFIRERLLGHESLEWLNLRSGFPNPIGSLGSLGCRRRSASCGALSRRGSPVGLPLAQRQLRRDRRAEASAPAGDPDQRSRARDIQGPGTRSGLSSSSGGSLLDAGESGVLSLASSDERPQLRHSNSASWSNASSRTDTSRGSLGSASSIDVPPSVSPSDGEADADDPDLQASPEEADDAAHANDVRDANRELTNFESQYGEKIAERRNQDLDLQRSLCDLRLAYCKPWDHMAQLCFFSGTLALMLASCLLVFCRFGYQQVQRPPVAGAVFPATPIAAGGFCLPCAVTLAGLLLLEWPVREFRRHFKAKIKEQTQSIRASESSTGLFGADATPEPHARTATALLHLLLALCFCVFVSVAAHSPPSAIVSDESPSHSAWGLSAQPELAFEILPLAHDVSWPPFWDPNGAAWWASGDMLLLSGSVGIVELTLDADAGVISHLDVRYTSSHLPLADLCVASFHDRADEVWAISDDMSSTILALDVGNGRSTVEVLRLVSNVFSDTQAYESSFSSDGAQIIGCTRAALDGSATHIWFAHGGTRWPILQGGSIARATEGINGTGQRPDEVLQGDSLMDAGHWWSTEWILEDPGFFRFFASTDCSSDGTTDALGGVALESVEAMGEGFLLLLTARCFPAAAPRPQVLLLVDADGSVLWWRRVAAPKGGGIDVTARWTSVALDTAGMRLFLIAGGVEPIVAAAPMPAW